MKIVSFLVLVFGGCASAPPQAPLVVGPISPGSGEKLGVDDVLYVLDASSSMSSRSDLEEEKSLLVSLASAEAWVTRSPESTT